MIKHILCLIFVIRAINTHVMPRVVTTKVEVSWISWNPDNNSTPRDVIAINGKFPGDPIRAKKGDRVQILFTNKLPGTYSDLHCHGIYQIKTLTSDGAGGINQCPSLYGGSYLYDFNTGSQTGNYWCHSHEGVELTDGHKVPLIIEDDNDPYLRPFDTWLSNKYTNCIKPKISSIFYVDHSVCGSGVDDVIQLTDWFHTKADDLLAYYIRPGGDGNEPRPDSALINGKGDYFCSNPPVGCKSMYDTQVIQGKGKRLRILNMSAMAVFYFAIDNHKLTVIECDGITLDGNLVVDVLRLNAGQRCSVIVKGDQDPKNYFIRAQMDLSIYPQPYINSYWQPQVYGVLSYVDNNCVTFTQTPPNTASFYAMDPLFDAAKAELQINVDQPITPYPGLYPPAPNYYTKRFELSIDMLTTADNRPALGFNGILQEMDMSTTLLYKVLKDLPYKNTRSDGSVLYGYNPLNYNYGDVVDFVIKNPDAGEHPIHWHGHSCYVMYQGNTNSGSDSYNIEYNPNAPYRDTATVNPNAALVIRCRADNPGIWPLHCHIDWHLAAGLMLNLVEGVDQIKQLYSCQSSLVKTCPTYPMIPTCSTPKSSKPM